MSELNTSPEASARAPAGPATVLPAPFVGRDSELEFLRERLNAAAGDAGGVTFIAGEPGIGKTRLLREFSAFARTAGWLVLSGRAYDSEGMPPYLPLIEAIGEHVRASSDADLQAILAEAPTVATLIPEIRRRFSTLAQEAPLGPEAERFRLFEGVSQFLLRAARSPEAQGLLLCLDDLHRADRPTLLLLLHLARKLPGAAVMLAATYRMGGAEQSVPLSSMLAEMGRERLDERLTLSPLSATETGVLVEGMTGAVPAAAVLQTIHGRTEGNPFFIEEVVRQLRSEGRDLTTSETALEEWGLPSGVLDAVAQRLSRLSLNARRLLQACAVLGTTLVPARLKGVTEFSEEALVSAFEEADAASMLREERTAYEFAHPLIRQVVYESLSLARRQQLHARAAEALAAERPSGHDGLLAAIGEHWRRAGDPGRAIGYLLRAGDAALGLTAWEEANRHWEAALECMEQTGQPAGRRARLLEGLGDIHFLSSFEAQTAVERYERAIWLYESAGETVGAARTHSKAGRSLAYPTNAYDFAAALDHLRAAESVLAGQAESVELGELYFAIAHAETHGLRSTPEKTLEAVRRLRAIAERLDNQFLRVAATSLEGHFLALEGRLAEGIGLEEQACDGALALRQSGLSLWSKQWREMLYGFSQEGDQATGRGASFQLARYFPSFLIPYTANCCGLQSLELADPIRARGKHETIRDAQGHFMSPFLLYDLFLSGDVATMRKLLNPAKRGFSTMNQEIATLAPLLLAWCEGRWPDVETAYSARLERFRRGNSNSLLALANRWLARLYRITGDAEKALAALQECLPLMETSNSVKLDFPIRAELALLLTETGRTAEAALHLTRCRQILANGEDWRGLPGRLALADAANAAANRDPDEAAAGFARAIDVFRRFHLPWDEAEAYELWAQSCTRFHQRARRYAFVAEKLSRARSVYERIEAGRPWLERLEALERRLGGESPVLSPPLPDDLTEREVEVLRLIADGRSNREIAGELVLSVRTVERHVTNIYAKIGARGKADATAYAIAHSLT